MTIILILMGFIEILFLFTVIILQIRKDLKVILLELVDMTFVATKKILLDLSMFADMGF